MNISDPPRAVGVNNCDQLSYTVTSPYCETAVDLLLPQCHQQSLVGMHDALGAIAVRKPRLIVRLYMNSTVLLGLR